MPNIDRSKNLPLIGIDIISISRIQKIAQKYGDHFLERFLSKDEIALTHHRPQSIAGFWAAKEACAKAIGTGIGRQNAHAAVGVVEIPGLAVADVLIEFQGLVLGEDAHGVDVGIHAVGKGKVDDAVLTAKGNGRFGGVLRQDLEPAALAAGQEHRDTALFLKIHKQVPP